MKSMTKSLIPAPLVNPVWVLHFHKVAVKIGELRQQHQPKNPQAFTNRVWARHLHQLISGGAK